MTAANLGSRITGYGFASSSSARCAWLATGLLTDQPALMWTNVVLTLLNIFGIWRWLGRQAKVEEGARAAAEASEATPGEALFPVSLLTRAPVGADEREARPLRRRHGRLPQRPARPISSSPKAASPASAKRLRRLPWSDAQVEGDEVVTELTPSSSRGSKSCQRDQWPAR